MHSVIPQDIMSHLPNTNLRYILRMFKWYDESRFIICDKNGYERLININTYDEEAYNSIPLYEELVKPCFENTWDEESGNKMRLYDNNISLPKNDTF